jgi:hypothetical protein
MEVVYLKLTNGDELFAKCMGEEKGSILLDDVMAMEIIATSDDSTKYMFMSRYSPYGNNHSMALEQSKVVFMSEVTDIVRSHYETSLQYANQISDDKFQEGIAEATKYLNFVLEQQKKKIKDPDIFDTVRDRVLGTFESDSTTKH